MTRRRLSRSAPETRPSTVALAFALAVIGLLFVASPRTGARLFGLGSQSEAPDLFRALGFRDLGLSLMLGAAARDPGATRAVSGGAAVIPTLDAILVARRRGRKGLPALALHGLSALLLAGNAVRAWRRSVSGR